MIAATDWNTNEAQLLLALGYCAFILLLFIVIRKFPPKKINSFYGYRTHRSMKNQETWDAANNYSLKTIVRLSLYCFVMPLFLYFIYPEINFIATILINTLFLILSIILTESHLKQHFDENGNPK